MAEISLNIRHALIISLGTSLKCRELIDEIYMKNEQRYYEIYLKSDFFEDCLKTIFSIKTEESINKLIGIVESCYIDNDFLKIEQIIRKFNPSISNFVKNSSIVNLEKFKQKYLADKIDELSETEIFTCYISLMYLAYIKNKQILGNVCIEFVQRYWSNYTQQLALHHFRYDLKFNGDFTEEVGSLYDVFELKPFEPLKEDKLELFLENFIESIINNKIKKNYDDIFKVPFDEYVNIRQNCFKEGILKYIGSFSRFLSTLGLEKLEIFEYIDFNNDELNVILKDFAMAVDGNNLLKSEKELYISSCIFIYALAEMYKQSKYMYLNKSKEEKYQDLKKLENKLNQSEIEFNQRKDNLLGNLSKKDEEIKKLKELLKEKDKEIRDLKNKVDKNTKNIVSLEQNNKLLLDENSMLVNMITTFDSVEDSPITLEEKIKYINKYKISLFGGYKNIDNLLDLLTNITSYKESTRDISSIKNSKIIFVMTNFFNHAFSKKISSLATKYNIPVRGIRNTNMDSIIEEIYLNLKSLES